MQHLLKKDGCYWSTEQTSFQHCVALRENRWSCLAMTKTMMRGHFYLILAISSAEPLSPIFLQENEPRQHEDLSFAEC